MTRVTRSRLCGLLLALPLLLAALPAAAAVDAAALAAARAAGRSGDSQHAISLYDALLATSPDDLTLLDESARQLSWAGRYDEALQRYQRALSIDPHDRFALVERAKVLSWAGRYQQAAGAFRDLLRQDAGDVEARLGLARVLSWSGQQAAARREYRQVLAAHPEDGDALLGVAQTYAWSGELAPARDAYQQAAARLADPLPAQVGLAYLDLWEGRLGRAEAEARSLAAARPDNKDVAGLQRAIRRARRPWVAADGSQLDDTDHNLLTVSRLETGMRLGGGWNAGLHYAHYDASTAGQTGTIDSVQATAGWTPRTGHHVDAMAGADRLESSQVSGYVVTDWGLDYRFPLAGSWQGWAGARREPYRYSVPLIDNRIVVNSFSTGASGSVLGSWFVSLEGNGWDLSDGNRRLAADAAARYRATLGRQHIEAGAVYHWLDWRQDVNHGYFDPQNFHAAGLTLRASGPLGTTTRVDYDLNVEAGVQSFDFRGQRTSADPYYVAVARLGWQVAAAARLEAYGEAGTYASEGSNHWRYTRFGARFVWQFGARP